MVRILCAVRWTQTAFTVYHLMPLVSQCCRGKKASPEEDEDDDLTCPSEEEEEEEEEMPAKKKQLPKGKQVGVASMHRICTCAALYVCKKVCASTQARLKATAGGHMPLLSQTLANTLRECVNICLLQFKLKNYFHQL